MATPNQSKGASSAAGASKVEEVTSFDDVMKQVENWEEEQIGFPPYWNPEAVGRKILCKVLTMDVSDPNFQRFVLQATRVPIPCKKGPADGAVDVIVNPGEMFTMSVYAALPLDRFFDCEVLIEVSGKRKLPANEASDGRPRDLWEFKARVSPETKRLLAARRSEEAKQLAAARTKGALTEAAAS